MAVKNYYSVVGQILGEEIVGTGARLDYLTDALGSVTATVTDAGVVENTYRYKPYGETLAKTGVGSDPKFLWVGSLGSRNTDRSYADNYNRARHYGRKQGSWISIDPLWPDKSAYAYADLSPVSFTDSSGLFPQKQILLPELPPIVQLPPVFELPPPATVIQQCCPDVATAQRMIGAAVLTGGVRAGSQLLSRIVCSCPHIAAALGGWFIGRYLDKQFGLSEKILNCMFPETDPIPIPPGTVPNGKCDGGELKRRQELMEKLCKVKDKYGDLTQERYCPLNGRNKGATRRKAEKCLAARKAVCDCYVGGCDANHKRVIGSIENQLEGCLSED